MECWSQDCWLEVEDVWQPCWSWIWVWGVQDQIAVGSSLQS